MDIVDGLTERVREVAGDLRLRADAVGDGLLAGLASCALQYR
ncbi:MAG: hypothetical protein AB1441_03035 [Bacillota bacterium]